MSDALNAATFAQDSARYARARPATHAFTIEALFAGRAG